MKLKIQSSCLLITLLLIVSCSKPEIHPIDRPVFPPSPFDLKSEYFRAQAWQKISTGYQMSIQSSRLTDSAINKGIKVSVALYSDWSTFYLIPSTIYDQDLPDTVNISYSVIQGQLKLISVAPFDITWKSDVLIEYK